jgi:signal transduction histidine kinase
VTFISSPNIEPNFQTLLGALPVGIMVVDSRGMIKSANRIMLDLLRYPTSCVGTPLSRFVPFVMAGLTKVIESLILENQNFEEIIEYEDDKGQLVSLHLEAKSVGSADGGRDFILILEDTTKTKKNELLVRNLERQLKKSQRMESFGLLAAGIAHDLNNVLSCIMGAGEILITTIENDARQEKLVSQVIEATQRGAEMTRKVLSLVRLESEELKPVDINQVVRDVMMLLKRSIHPRISIHSRLSMGHCSITGDNTLIHQIMMNLCVNARDAIQNEGVMELKTSIISGNDAAELGMRSNDTVWSAQLRDVALAGDKQKQKFIMIEVCDTGSGISKEQVKRIFNPFFTSKPQDAGTGLGLSMVLHAVKEMVGFLTVSSNPGTGTRFQVLLPKLEDEGKSLPKKIDRLKLSEGCGSVLVVDDDETVRSTTCEMLVQLGYKVQDAFDGLDAIEKIEKSPEPFDLIVLDLLMPRMDGAETLRRIVKINSEQAVLVVSGFANDKIINELQLIKNVNVVHKPFRFDLFSKIVADLIN